MRLQVLELPTRRLGPAEETPYLLVLSEVEDPSTIKEYTTEEIEERFGARGLMVFSSPVELGPPPPEPIRGARPKLADGGVPAAGPANGR